MKVNYAHRFKESRANDAHREYMSAASDVIIHLVVSRDPNLVRVDTYGFLHKYSDCKEILLDLNEASKKQFRMMCGSQFSQNDG